MKIAIFGSGAIGGYLGGRLAQAGHDVRFIARGEHLDAIATEGLRVNSISGDFTIHPANATDQAGEIGVVDMVLCGVKSWQVPQITHEMAKMIGPHTVVITIQNGVEAHTTLSRSLGGEHILPGLCKMICMIEAPGLIRHAAVDPYLAFGEADGRVTPRVLKIADLFAGAQGLTVDVSEDIIADRGER